MSTENLLAKMTAHGIQISGEGFGGKVDISCTDVAAACAGMREPVYMLMLLKFCADKAAAKPMQIYIAQLMHKENPAMPLARCMDLALVVLVQEVGGYICKTCDGTGRARYAVCRGCKGSGKADISQRERARLVGIDESTYRRSYAKLVEAWAAQAGQWESEGLRHVWRQCRGAA